VFLDNFGKILAQIFRAPTSVNSPTFTVEGTSTTRSCVLYALIGNTGRMNFEAQATKTRVGKGTTPATRQDTNIEDPFTNAPEDSLFDNSLAGYNSGLGKVTAPASVAPTGGSGTISEMIIVNVFRASNTNIFEVAMTRDNVSPLVNFISGKTISTALEVLI